MSYTVSGDKEIIVNLKKLSSKLQGEALGEALLTGAKVVEGQAKINVREWDLIDTGNMMNSILAWPVSNKEAEVGVGAEYGIYHEMGTSRGLPARPYLLPALKSEAPKVQRVVATSLKAAIGRAL
jgi:HK97 gp10 family phage protein